MELMILPDLHMTRESESYIDAMHIILTRLRWIEVSKPILSGMTAAAFRFTVNRRLTGESPTAYNWMADNFVAADFLGVTSSQSAGFSFNPTFPLYQRQAVLDIKGSIDRGAGAVFWKDGFMVAAGYDDRKQILHYSDGSGDRYLMLPYEEFGINRSPYWYYQIFEDRIKLDPIEVYKESLIQAVYKWEEHDIMLPGSDYACGSAVYDAVLEALRSGDYDPAGLCEIFRCYAASKRDIHAYMQHLAQIWPALHPSAEAYGTTADIFQEVLQAAAEFQKDRDVQQKPASAFGFMTNQLIELQGKAQEAESEAIRQIKWFMRERIENRFEDIGLR